MTRIRKTASIAAVLKRINFKLLHSTCSGDVRRGMADVLGTILMDAGLYSGYGYLTRADLKRVDNWSEDPGIEFRDPEGKAVLADVYYAEAQKAKAGDYICRYSKKFPDESRRFYYVHPAISSEYRRLATDGESGD